MQENVELFPYPDYIITYNIDFIPFSMAYKLYYMHYAPVMWVYTTPNLIVPYYVYLIGAAKFSILK